MYAKMFGHQLLFTTENLLLWNTTDLCLTKKIHFHFTLDVLRITSWSLLFGWINREDTVISSVFWCWEPAQCQLMWQETFGFLSKACSSWPSFYGGSMHLPPSNTDPAARHTWGQSPKEVMALLCTSIHRKLSQRSTKASFMLGAQKA